MSVAPQLGNSVMPLVVDIGGDPRLTMAGPSSEGPWS